MLSIQQTYDLTIIAITKLSHVSQHSTDLAHTCDLLLLCYGLRLMLDRVVSCQVVGRYSQVVALLLTMYLGDISIVLIFFFFGNNPFRSGLSGVETPSAFDPGSIVLV